MWDEAKRRAKALLQDREALKNLLTRTDSKLKKHQESLKEIYSEASCLVRLLKAWVFREYSDIDVQSLVMITAGLIYFLNPLDLVPDFLIGGIVDDAMVLGGILSVVHHEVEKFRKFENQKLRARSVN